MKLYILNQGVQMQLDLPLKLSYKDHNLLHSTPSKHFMFRNFSQLIRKQKANNPISFQTPKLFLFSTKYEKPNCFHQRTTPWVSPSQEKRDTNDNENKLNRRKDTIISLGDNMNSPSILRWLCNKILFCFIPPFSENFNKNKQI